MPRPRAAVSFARSLFRPGERVAVVLVPRGPGAEAGRVTQRLLSLEAAVSPKVQGWLRYENARRRDVFLGMNPVAAGARGRLKGDLAEVRRLYLDIDERGPERAAQLQRDVAAGTAPQPRHLVATSPGRYQAIWTCAAPLPPPEAERLMRRLVLKYGADPAAVDVSRVLRWPGFRNHKREPSSLVIARSWPRAAPARPEDFRELPELPRAGSRGAGAAAPRTGAPGGTQSERDWAWVHRRLRAGDPPAAIEADLERRRGDKPRPGYYARLTVSKAAAQRARRQERQR